MLKLVALSANKASFKTIKFNASGLTLIVGQETSRSGANNKKTYNAVGKTLILRLVHFCLGSNKSKIFSSKLQGWEFKLQFQFANVPYTVVRSTEDQSVVALNGEVLTLKEYRAKLLKLISPNAVDGIHFRSLITRFSRLSRVGYNSADKFVNKEKPYDQLLHNTFLLGLDPELVKKKYQLKTEKDRIKALKAGFVSDPILKNYQAQGRDTSIDQKDLEEQIKNLTNNIQSFKVAEDFHKIQKEADEVALRIREYEKKRVVLLNSLASIDKSLQQKLDVPSEKIEKVYEEAKTILNKESVLQLQDVMTFHSKLTSSRLERLSREKNRIKGELKEVEKSIATDGNALDHHLQYLNSHKALDELSALNHRRSDLMLQLKKLQEFERLEKDYTIHIQKISIELQEQNLSAQEYLDNAKTILDKNVEIFRGLSKEFYEDKPGGISVLNNIRDNQIRYDLKIKIQDDSSDGVNEVKIFCFDMTLLLAKHNHNVGFLFHDSRLFSNMDLRQRNTLFRLANKYAEDRGLQYIATVNQDQLDSFRDRLTEAEYKQIIEDHIVERLTDKSDQDKLLGIQVDMDFDD